MFKFKCISSHCTYTENRLYVKAITGNGNTDMIIYGKHSDIDTLTYMEVQGKIKDVNSRYLVVNSLNIIDRFETIRDSFSKLSTAMFFLEIVYRSNSNLNILLEGLEKLKRTDINSALIHFLCTFLIYNGIFNREGFNQHELFIIDTICINNNYKKASARFNVSTLLSLKNKLIKKVQIYINQPLNSLKLLRLSQ